MKILTKPFKTFQIFLSNTQKFPTKSPFKSQKNIIFQKHLKDGKTFLKCKENY